MAQLRSHAARNNERVARLRSRIALQLVPDAFEARRRAQEDGESVKRHKRLHKKQVDAKHKRELASKAQRGGMQAHVPAGFQLPSGW